MSENTKGHLLHYKNEEGQWVPLPMSVVNVYDIYVSYCNSNGITPVDEITYYQTLGSLQGLVTDLAGSTAAIASLNAAIGAGVLPLSKGGTGQAYDSESDFIDSIEDKLNLQNRLDTVRENAIVAVQNEVKAIATKLDASEINKGTSTPGANTPGTYYFQY